MTETVRIHCPQCGAKLKLRDASAFGKPFRCPQCSASFVADAALTGNENEDRFLTELASLGEDFGAPIEVYRPAPVRKRSSAQPALDSANQPTPKKRRVRRRADTGERFPQYTWPLFGLVGGALGGAFWVLVYHMTRFMVGYIALLIGLLVGLGVRIAAGQRDGWAPGLTAAGTAVFVALVVKLIVAYLFVKNTLGFMHEGEVTERAMVLKIAHEVAGEFERKGIKTRWPHGILPSEAAEPEDFPDMIWDEAQERWDNKTPDERQAEMKQAQRGFNAVHGFAIGLVFLAGFNVFDFVWFGLAAFAAFKIGSAATD